MYSIFNQVELRQALHPYLFLTQVRYPSAHDSLYFPFLLISCALFDLISHRPTGHQFLTFLIHPQNLSVFLSKRTYLMSSYLISFITIHLRHLLPYSSPPHLWSQAVRNGSIQRFNEVVAKYGPAFKADKNHTLVQRLGHNVLKTGIVERASDLFFYSSFFLTLFDNVSPLFVSPPDILLLTLICSKTRASERFLDCCSCKLQPSLVSYFIRLSYLTYPHFTSPSITSPHLCSHSLLDILSSDPDFSSFLSYLGALLTGLRKISVSYSRISLSDIASKLHLPSASAAEYICAKAIR